MAADAKSLLECQWCQGMITGRDLTKICKTCDTAIHADCWESFDKDCPTSHCGARDGWIDGRGTRKEAAPVPEAEMKGKKCRYCKGDIRATDPTKICNNCSEVLHTFCWQAGRQLCPTPGCAAKSGWSEGRGPQKLVKLPEKKEMPATISSSLGRFLRQLLPGRGGAK